MFKAAGRDDYVMPCATYEMASLAWAECCHAPEHNDTSHVAAEKPPQQPEKQEEQDQENGQRGLGAHADVLTYRKAKMEECQRYLDRVMAWETFVLDARIGMRVQSGLETLKWFRRRMGWDV